MKECLKKNCYVLISIVLGIVLFGMVYGYKVVNPTYDDWIYARTGQDINQHYIGWQYYRNTPWQYPIGMIEGLSPKPVSVVYTDSIPIFAIIFKILSPILPETFQYLGIWGLMCFILQSVISALIIHKFTKNKVYSVIGSTFFTISYVVLVRMFGHTALAGNWIILLSMWLYVYRNDFKSNFSRSLSWILVVMLSIMVHMYFLPIVLCIMCGDILEDILTKKNIYDCIIRLTLSITSVVAAANVLGMFSGNKSEITNSDFGIYCSNLNSFYNPIDNSKFIKRLPLFFHNAEGSAYIGFGLILGFILLMILYIYFGAKGRFQNALEMIKNHGKSIVSVGVVLIISSFFAITPNVTFNDKLLFSFEYPEKINNLLSVFRANGRFIWITMYFIMLLVVIGLYRIVANNKIPLVVLSALLVFQMVDYSNLIKSKHEYFNQELVYSSPLKNELWSALGQSRSHIEIVPIARNYLQQTEFYYPLAIYGAKYHLSLSSFIVARSSYESHLSHSKNVIAELQSGIPNYDTIYIFNDGAYIPNVPNFKATIIDGYTVGYYI